MTEPPGNSGGQQDDIDALEQRVQKLRNALHWVASVTSEPPVRAHARKVLYDD